MSGGRSNVRCPCHPKQTDGEVSQRGHHLGAVASADLRAILIEGDVTHPVQTVFNLPLTAVELQQIGRRGFLFGEARHPVDHLMA